MRNRTIEFIKEYPKMIISHPLLMVRLAPLMLLFAICLTVAEEFHSEWATLISFILFHVTWTVGIVDGTIQAMSDTERRLAKNGKNKKAKEKRVHR